MGRREKWRLCLEQIRRIRMIRRIRSRLVIGTRPERLSHEQHLAFTVRRRQSDLVESPRERIPVAATQLELRPVTQHDRILTVRMRLECADA